MKKSIMVKTELDEKIAELAKKTDKKILVVWACDCAKRVLPYFEKKYPGDKRPRLALAAGRLWVKTGVFEMTVIRGASLSVHTAAREAEEYSAARSAARAAGQAVATAHASGHSIAAAIYAATAVRDGVKKGDALTRVIKEREWQYRNLLKLRND
jgi:hypothetical protein